MTSATADMTFETTSRTLAGAEPLHYHEAGSGPALVLLHGSGPGVSGWSNFGASLQFFARRFRSLIPDQPGFGLSPAPAMDRPYHRISADAVVRLLDELGVERAHVLGNSMGGSVAARFALDHPDRLDRLVLMGPGGVGAGILAPSPSEGLKRLVEFTAEPTRDRLVAWLRTMVSDQATVTEELIDERLRNALAPGALEWMRLFFSHVSGNSRRPMEDLPLWAEVRRIAAPTLLAWGRDDRVTPLEMALLPLRQMRDVELHVFSGCGHWAMIERREEFQRVVAEFLAR
jgi:pimeloyl-ACP methyl ester carboxylesterase